MPAIVMAASSIISAITVFLLTHACYCSSPRPRNFSEKLRSHDAQ